MLNKVSSANTGIKIGANHGNNAQKQETLGNALKSLWQPLEEYMEEHPDLLIGKPANSGKKLDVYI